MLATLDQQREDVVGWGRAHFRLQERRRCDRSFGHAGDHVAHAQARVIARATAIDRDDERASRSEDAEPFAQRWREVGDGYAQTRDRQRRLDRLE